MNYTNRVLYFLLLTIFFAACSGDAPPATKEEAPAKIKVQFTSLPVDQTGVDFQNRLPDDPLYNIWNSDYFYGGGGVAVGDVNNDGLEDLFFTSNFTPSELYLNKGNLTFEKITEKAGINTSNGWTTGACFADVNNDGLLDLYVCKTLNGENPAHSINQLFINKGNLQFSEAAAEYGLADAGHSVHANFIDFDKDGDLDAYVINTPYHKTMGRDLQMKAYQLSKNKDFKDKFYENRNGRFVDISTKAGISDLKAWGLSVTAGDLNNDGWIDLFVANDYDEPDFYYLNQGNGRFKEQAKSSFRHLSNSSMGSDIADINNDGWADIFVSEMLAEDNYRQKTNMASMNPQRFWGNVERGFHYQYMHNALQLNNGNGSFSEIAHMAGVAKTDWSWTSLLADFDNDGLKDLFVTNGFKKDVRNLDFSAHFQQFFGRENVDVKGLLDKVPSHKLPNYIFRNEGNLTFSKRSKSWGLSQKGFSNGAAYADLDKDGDLDLVVNNIDGYAAIYSSNVADGGGHYLRLKLNAKEGNRFAIGSKVEIHYGDGQYQMQELSPIRGYLSNSEFAVHFGLAKAQTIDKIDITWPNGKMQSLSNVKANQLLELTYDAAVVTNKEAKPAGPAPVFVAADNQLSSAFYHSEKAFDDFATEVLLPRKFSQEGPPLAVGDVNGDGLEDLFVGNGAGAEAAWYIQKVTGGFAKKGFGKDRQYEDVAALLFDADGDGDADLYVASGSNEYKSNAALMQDRLYLNDGQGNFKQAKDKLPPMAGLESCVRAADYDGDGDLDLFVGGRVVAGQYPRAPRSYLLVNDGGRFRDATAEAAKALQNVGMVTDALWTDFNNDGRQDILLVGEWMSPRFFQNNGSTFEEVTSEGIAGKKGWWNSLTAADFDQDGDLDYIAGNLGLNAKYKASPIEPFRIYANDFDQSGSLDIVLAYYNDGVCYPVRGRECSTQQMPALVNRVQSYDQWGRSDVKAIYGEKALEGALAYEATEFSSCYIENVGNGQFLARPLPMEAQLSSTMGLLAGDFDEDGHQDILLCGNFYPYEVETTRQDAGSGLLLNGDGKGQFIPQAINDSGFYAGKDARTMVKVAASGGGYYIFVGNNNDQLQIFYFKAAAT